MQKLYTDKTFLNVNENNRHVETQVNVYWTHDEFPEGDFDLGDPVENKKYLKKFETGEYLCISVLVEVSAEGESGFDSLGMCHIKTKDLETEIRNIIAEHDMKNNACRELKANILDKAVRLNKYILNNPKV